MGINMSRQSNSHHDTGMAKPQPSLLAGTGPRGLVVKEPRLSCSIGEDGAALAEVVHDSMHDLTGNVIPKIKVKNTIVRCCVTRNSMKRRSKSTKLLSTQ
ncbi:unnamed protein product [Brassica oleracea var. botrytis]